MTNLLETPPTGPAATLPPPPTGPRPTMSPGEPRRTPMAARFLWKVFAALLVVGALVWGPYSVITLLAHEEHDENESYAAAGLTTLDVDGATGSITITAAETDTVHVKARISDGLRKTGESRRVDGDTLRLQSSCPNFGSNWCHVNWDVTMPARMAVVIDNGDGHISVTGTTSSVDIRNDNGTVELSGVTGPVKVSTDNGGLRADGLSSKTVSASSDNGRVSLAFTKPPTTVAVTTDNGRAEVVVPRDGTAYHVVTHADNGSVDDSTVPKDSASTRSITVRTDNGAISIRTAPS
jgi:DUF4097 and DUF4098 domain-containing protein YvlB